MVGLIKNINFLGWYELPCVSMNEGFDHLHSASLRINSETTKMNSPNRPEIFDSAVKEHSGAMLHYLYSLCNDWQIAEDLSQDLWKAVHRSFKTEAVQQKPLLYNKAKQVFIDYYRKKKRRVELDYTDELPEPVLMPMRTEPESKEDDDLLYDRFWEMFYPDKYDEVSKRIFWLKERYDYSMDEITEITGIARSTAHDKLKRLKIACRLRLEINQRTEEREENNQHA